MIANLKKVAIFILRLSSFQADHIGGAENGFQSIAQLVPCFALFVGVVVEQIHPVNF